MLPPSPQSSMRRRAIPPRNHALDRPDIRRAPRRHPGPGDGEWNTGWLLARTEAGCRTAAAQSSPSRNRGRQLAIPVGRGHHPMRARPTIGRCERNRPHAFEQASGGNPKADPSDRRFGHPPVPRVGRGEGAAGKIRNARCPGRENRIRNGTVAAGRIEFRRGPNLAGCRFIEAVPLAVEVGHAAVYGVGLIEPLEQFRYWLSFPEFPANQHQFGGENLHAGSPQNHHPVHRSNRRIYWCLRDWI